MNGFLKIVFFVCVFIFCTVELFAQTFTMQCGIYTSGSDFAIKLRPTDNMPSGTDGKVIQTNFTIRYKASLGSAVFSPAATSSGNNPLNIVEGGSFEAEDASGVNWKYHVLMNNSAVAAPSSDKFPWAANTIHQILIFSVAGLANAADVMELVQDANTSAYGTDWYFYIQDYNNVASTATPYYKPYANQNSLPVELLAFTAKPTTNATLLNWSTTWEQDNKGFEVMKRLEGEAEFKKIGFVSGKGASTQIENYKFEDKQLFSGTTYYMLRQIDFDNTASNSQIVAVNNRQKGQLYLSIYPNPTTSLVRFNTTSEVNLFTVHLYSTDGKLVLTKEVKNGEDLSVAHLPQGMYQLIYNTQTGETGSGKLIIQK